MKFTKKKLTACIAVVTVLTLLVGVTAFFTDRVDAKATASTAQVSDIIQVTPDPDKYPEGGDPQGGNDNNPQNILEAKWNKNNGDDGIQPGEEIDLSYDLKNIGEADIDVKETIILTVTDPSGRPIDLDIPEFRLFLKSTTDANGAIEGVTGALNVVGVEKVSDNQVKYTLAGFTLEKDEEISRPYKLVMDKYTGNAFQGATCTVDYLVEMRQHVDSIQPDELWDSMRTATTSFAGYARYSVVPAA